MSAGFLHLESTIGTALGKPLRLSRFEVGEIVNLRKVRKAQSRAEAEKTAATNRVLHGETKAQRSARRADKALQDQRLDGHALTKREET